MAVGPSTNTTTQAVYKEVYRSVVAKMLEAEAKVIRNINEKTDVELIGPRGVRVAKLFKQGGQVATFDPNGGGLGRGSGPVFDYATLTTIPLRVAVEITKAAQWNTSDPAIAIQNVKKLVSAHAVSEYNAQMERYIFGNGDGSMAQVSSVTNPTTYVMTTTNGYGSQGIRKGHKYAIYDTNFVPRNLTVAVDTNDEPNATVVLTSGTAGISANDRFLPEGVTGSSPAWFNGFQNLFSSSATGTWLGMSRATYPELRTVEVLGGGNALNPSLFRNLKGRMSLLRDGVFDKGRWSVVFHPAQAQAAEEYALSLARFDRSASSEGRSGIDFMYDVSKLSLDGIPVTVSRNAIPSRLELTNWDNWFRVETIPFGLYTVDEMSTFPIYDATGGLATADIMYMCQLCQFGADDPQLGGFISNLAIPAGYVGGS